MKSSHKGASFYIRLAISLGLIAFLFYKVDLVRLWSVLKGVNAFYLVLSIAMTPILIFVSSWKWQVILKALGIREPLHRLFGLYMVGYFFNSVLPTNVGGDVVRAYILGKSTRKNAEAFSSVFVERFTGLTALLAMAIVACFLAIREFWNTWFIAAMVVCIAGYLGIIAIIISPQFFRWAIGHIKISLMKKVLQKLQKFQEATLSLRKHKGTLFFAMINSFLFYLVAVANVYVSALAFNAPITFFNAVIVTPIVLVITMIPISIGGIGLSEGAYFFAFARLGIGSAFGLSVAILMRLKALLIGLAGGIYYMLMGYKIDETTLTNGKSRSISHDDFEGDVNYFSSFEDIMRQKKSPLRKYQDIVMGRYDIPSLIKFELLTLFFGPLPGILGYFMRKIFYKAIFQHTGKGTVFGRSISLRHTHKVSIGKNCVIDEYAMISAQGNQDSRIQLGNEVLIGRGTSIATRDGEIIIGDFSNIGASCRLGTTTRIHLGKHVLFAANCYVGGAHHRFDRTDIPIMRQGYESKGGVVIEDDVWLGTDVKVLDGVTIGRGSVIGAGSVVTKDIPPYSIAAGTPAKIISSRKSVDKTEASGIG